METQNLKIETSNFIDISHFMNGIHCSISPNIIYKTKAKNNRYFRTKNGKNVNEFRIFPKKKKKMI